MVILHQVGLHDMLTNLTLAARHIVSSNPIKTDTFFTRALVIFFTVVSQAYNVWIVVLFPVSWTFPIDYITTMLKVVERHDG